MFRAPSCSIMPASPCLLRPLLASQVARAQYMRRPRKEATMPTYVMLANWTDQGVRAIEDGPKRVDVARKSLEEMGGRFLSVYMTMGVHDMVFTYEAPDDAVAARFTLML